MARLCAALRNAAALTPAACVGGRSGRLASSLLVLARPRSSPNVVYPRVPGARRLRFGCTDFPAAASLGARGGLGLWDGLL
eukprot:1250017-Prymnesium_polylepis.1